MSYGVYIAAVESQQIDRLRSRRQQTVRSSRVIAVSHLVTSWVKEEPLRSSLAQLVDGGAPLAPEFWHPLRAPAVQSSLAARVMADNVRSAWLALSEEVRQNHMFRVEIGEIIDLLEFAVRNECSIVSVLEPPADDERAKLVECPFDPRDRLPMPWGELMTMDRGRPRS